MQRIVQYSVYHACGNIRFFKEEKKKNTTNEYVGYYHYPACMCPGEELFQTSFLLNVFYSTCYLPALNRIAVFCLKEHETATPVQR